MCPSHVQPHTQKQTNTCCRIQQMYQDSTEPVSFCLKREENIVRKRLAVMSGRVTYNSEILMRDGAFSSEFSQQKQRRGPHAALQTHYQNGWFHAQLTGRPQEITNTTCCPTTNEIISRGKRVCQQIMQTRNISSCVMNETEASVSASIKQDG